MFSTSCPLALQDLSLFRTAPKILLSFVEALEGSPPTSDGSSGREPINAGFPLQSIKFLFDGPA